ncbi:bifunctional NAD(P)H-hydrate repair enzyme Nnr [Spirochaetia bacterium]|nr:bifunctional NAD(P)H-hydrate repair enzyme Nnr [Spirochaetia bacterium]
MSIHKGPVTLLSAASARALDAEASASWGLDSFVLVEAAGRLCARVLAAAFPEFFPPKNNPFMVVLAGSGNNAADAMVMLRSLLLSGHVDGEGAALVINKVPEKEPRSPRSEAFLSLQKMGVPAAVWEQDAALIEGLLSRADIIIDGIAGTGLDGPLQGSAAEMLALINKYKDTKLLISIDLPSGNSDSWQPGMPIAKAGATLAIEPLKLCLFRPAARPYSGAILPVGEIFPPQLIGQFHSQKNISAEGRTRSSAELIDWDQAARLIPPVSSAAYKHERGVVEIRAGSPDAPGAARIAARGAQAAGAGLIRLVVDQAIHPILAANAGGIMVAGTGNTAAEVGDGARFSPDAILLGPGWGKSPDREVMLRHALEQEAAGIPLILDADAILLAKDCVFHGNALLTPHPGELAAYAGVSKDGLLSDPAPLLLKVAAEKKAVILFKSHVMYAASPDGRLGIIDGMQAVLGMGGSGDLLAGFCAGIAARQKSAGRVEGGSGGMANTGLPDSGLYFCALAAAALLIESAKSPESGSRFLDPLELADTAADLAGKAWLPGRLCHG